MFTIWLASFPFILLYGAYEGPKIFWLWIGGFFLTLSWLLRSKKSEFLEIDGESRWLVSWIILLVFASAFGVHLLDSFIGGSYRHQGVLFFFTLFLIGETVRKISVKQKRFLSFLLVAAVAIESIIVLGQKLSAFAARPLGTFGEPNAVAGYLAIGLMWIVWAPLKKPLYRICLYIVTLLAIAATASRTGIASAVLISIGVGVVTLMKHTTKRIQQGLIVATCFIVAILSLFLIQSITRARPTSIYEDRMLFWQLGIQEFMKQPLLGYGAESGEVVYTKGFQTINVRLVDFMVDRSHNLFLDIALWSGIGGLVVFVGWLLVCLRRLMRKQEYLRLFAVVAWILFASFQPLGVVHWIQLLLLFYLM